MRPFFAFLNRYSLRQKLIIAACIPLLAYNLFQLIVHDKVQLQNTIVPWEPGLQFAQFKKHLEGVREAGYITDGSTEGEFYYQAQYFLVPTVLKRDQLDYEYNIVDSNNIPFILKSILDTKSVRLVSTDYGQALIKKK